MNSKQSVNPDRPPKPKQQATGTAGVKTYKTRREMIHDWRTGKIGMLEPVRVLEDDQK